MALVISDKWWERELVRGERSFRQGNYQRAMICFYRAAQHAEFAVQLGADSFPEFSPHQLLNRAYRRLSDTFARMNDPALHHYYGDLAELSLCRAEGQIHR